MLQKKITINIGRYERYTAILSIDFKSNIARVFMDNGVSGFYVMQIDSDGTHVSPSASRLRNRYIKEITKVSEILFKRLSN
jgi:hypothetical protein